MRWSGLLKAVSLALVACAAGAIFVGTSSAQMDRPYIGIKPVRWASSQATICTGCPVDSIYKNLDGTGTSTPTVDTTRVVDTFDWDWTSMSVGPTATGVAKVWIMSASGTVSTTDTLFVNVDTSPDGSNWSLGVQTAYALFATANDNVASVPLLQDADAQKDIAFARFLRFRVKSDNSASSTFKNAQLFVSYLKRSTTTGQ